MAKKAYIGVGGKARRISKGYIGVYQDAQTICSYLEYIRNSGTQSIDTEIYLDFSKDITIETEISVSATGNRYAYFSTYKSSSYDSFCLEVTAENKLRVYLNANDISATGGSVAANTKYKIKFTFNASSNTYVLYQNGAQVLTGSITYTGTIPYSARIFYDHRNNAASTFPSPLNVYSLSVQNGTKSVNLRPVKRASDNVVCLYDTVSKRFFTNLGSGTFTAGAATGETVTKAAGNYARKIKKAYIGIGGVARPCWHDGALTYYGAISPLSEARDNLGAASVGNYALFGGGKQSSSYKKTVDAYDASLTKTTPTALNDASAWGAGASNKYYALFAGGMDATPAVSSSVTAYNQVLTRSQPTDLSAARYMLSGGGTDAYALFVGGYNDVKNLSTVDAYDASLTRTTPTALSTARYYSATASVGDHIFVGCGYTTEPSAVVDVYNASLTRTKTTLTTARNRCAATNLGAYAVFAGGATASSGETSAVEAVNANLTKINLPALSAAKRILSATTVQDFALFGGGQTGSTYLNTVDVYDASFTRTTATNMSAAKSGCSAVTVGNYALFGGGYSSATVEAYTVI